VTFKGDNQGRPRAETQRRGAGNCKGVKLLRGCFGCLFSPHTSPFALHPRSAETLRKAKGVTLVRS